MAGTKLGSSGVVGHSNSPQDTSGLFTSVIATSGTRLPSLLWLVLCEEALQYENLIGHDVSELPFHRLIRLPQTKRQLPG